MLDQTPLPGDVLRGISAARRGIPRVQVLTGPPGSGRTTVVDAVRARPDLPSGFAVVDDVLELDDARRLLEDGRANGLLMAVPRPLAAAIAGEVDDVVVVGPLGPDDARTLVRTVLSHAPDAVVDAVVQQGEGNPAALLQAARSALHAAPAPRESPSPPAPLTPLAPLTPSERPAPLDLPTTLDLPARAVPAAFVELLQRLDPAATSVVRLLVVLGPTPVAQLTAAMRNGRGPELDAAAVDRAVWLDVVERDGDTVRLVHPALGWAAWALARNTDRRGSSLALARHPGLDPGDAAQHLIRAGLALHPDELQLVEEQAGAAAGRGQLAVAATLWQGVAAQTADTDRRARLLGQAGLATAGTGRLDGAGILLDRALDTEVDPVRRAELASVAATLETLTGQPESARWRLLGELERLRTTDRSAAARVLAALTFPDGIIGDMGAAIAHGEEAVEHGVLDSPLAGTVSGVLAHAYAVRGDPAAAAWADRALAAVHADAVPADQLGVVTLHIGVSLAMLDRGGEALDAIERLEHRILTRGMRDAAAIPSGMRAELAWRRGDWDIAMRELDTTVELASATMQSSWRAFARVAWARIAVRRGDHEAARTAVAAGRADIDAGRLALTDYIMDGVEGLIALAEGRPDKALEHLQRCLATDGRVGPINADYGRYRPALVEAALAVGRRALAEEALASMPTTSCGGWTAGAEAMMDGMLQEDPERGVARLADAAAAWGGSPYDRARAQLLAARRRAASGMAPDDAAAVEAHDTLRALGADGLADEAYQLRASATHGLSGLGPVRRAVVLAAARGRRSAEIGEELGISPRTVDNHLHRAYRHLGVSSRAELARLVGPDGP